MEVPTITEWDGTRRYLEMLAQTVVNDIVPLLSTVGGAPHAIAREVFCYVDHLGHLFAGDDSSSNRFKCYLRHVMALVDANYAQRANVLYEMYRNGPIHEFDPKELQNNGTILAWLSYPGQRHEPELLLQHPRSHSAYRVTHLTPLRLEGEQKYYLPVSTNCLIRDLLSSIDKFTDGAVGTEATRIAAWNAAAKALKGPKEVKFVLEV